LEQKEHWICGKLVDPKMAEQKPDVQSSNSGNGSDSEVVKIGVSGIQGGIQGGVQIQNETHLDLETKNNNVVTPIIANGAVPVVYLPMVPINSSTGSPASVYPQVLAGPYSLKIKLEYLFEKKS